jgi:hypothetical protein
LWRAKGEAMTFEEFFNTYAWCGEAKQQTKDAWDKGAEEKEEEMLEFAEWYAADTFKGCYEVITNASEYDTIGKAFAHWKKNVEGKTK